MSRAIAFLTMPTGTTGAGRVAWIGQHHAHTFSLCLIGYEQSQLVEGPTRALPSLRPSNRCSLPNPFQVFERECLTIVFGLPNKLLADLVIHLTLKACLFARKLPQSPAGAAGVALLEALAMLKATFAVCAAILLAIRISGKVDQTEIDTYHPQTGRWNPSDRISRETRGLQQL